MLSTPQSFKGLLPYMFIIPAPCGACGVCSRSYHPWSQKMGVGRLWSQRPSSWEGWVRRCWRAWWWMHEGGLYQPLEILVGCDGIEAWYKLTATSHCKFLDTWKESMDKFKSSICSHLPWSNIMKVKHKWWSTLYIFPYMPHLSYLYILFIHIILCIHFTIRICRYYNHLINK